jgi:hypothetical protein
VVIRLIGLLMGILWLVAPLDSQVTGDYAIEATISNPRPYVGETIRYTVRYYAYNFDRLPTVEPVIFPEFQNFWLGDGYEGEPQAVTINQVQYLMGEFTFEIIPLMTGAMTISPSQLILLETAYDGARVESSNEIMLEVLPLPPNPPDNFVGGVGQYSVNFRLEALDLSVGDSVRLIAEVTSRGGDLAYLKPPQLIVGDEWHITAGQLHPAIRSSFNLMLQVREFEWALIPLQSGLLTVDGLAFSYFDPLQETYVEISQAPIQVNVTGGQSLDILPALDTQIPLKVIGKNDRFSYPDDGLWIVPTGLLGLVILLRLYQPYQQRRARDKRYRQALQRALSRIDDLNHHPYQQLNLRAQSIINLYLKDKGRERLAEHDGELVQKVLLSAQELAYKPQIVPVEQQAFITQFQAVMTQIDEEWGRS